MKNYFVYILTNKKNGVLYIGVTNNLGRRTFEHKEKVNEGFSEKYHTSKLIYYEISSDVQTAINREKQLKKRRRKRKIDLIEKENPEWKDLFDDILMTFLIYKAPVAKLNTGATIILFLFFFNFRNLLLIFFYFFLIL